MFLEFSLLVCANICSQNLLENSRTTHKHTHTYTHDANALIFTSKLAWFPFFSLFFPFGELAHLIVRAQFVQTHTHSQTHTQSQFSVKFETIFCRQPDQGQSRISMNYVVGERKREREQGTQKEQRKHMFVNFKMSRQMCIWHIKLGNLTSIKKTESCKTEKKTAKSKWTCRACRLWKNQPSQTKHAREKQPTKTNEKYSKRDKGNG